MGTERNGRMNQRSVIGKCPRCGSGVAARMTTAELQTVSWQVRCGRCNCRTVMVPVQGSYSTRRCNALCQGATGPVCSCECGGENHGRMFLWISEARQQVGEVAPVGETGEVALFDL